MSIEAMKWAMDEAEARNLSMAQRYLLLMLGNAADHRGANLFPSHSHLARRTGMAKSTVRVHLAALEQAGLLARQPRKRAHDGSQTSNLYQLAMPQAGLDLEDDVIPPHAGIRHGGGAEQPAPPVPTAAGTRELGDVKGRTSKAAGQGKPSPVAALFKVYHDGIAKAYGAEEPPSAKTNGQLAAIVRQLGAEPAMQVVRHYLASRKPYYVTRKHAMDVLAKDARDIWIEIQQAAGGAGAPRVTTAQVYLEYVDAERSRMAEYPAGDALEIAKTFAREYASKVNRETVSCVTIRQGSSERRFKREELR